MKVHEIATQKIINILEKGNIPWKKPWKAGMRPHNALTKRSYNGGNLILLSCLPFERQAYLTFNQIKNSGARIKAGEEKKHFPVFFWSPATYDENGEMIKPPFLRYFLVWNIEQVEGIDYENPFDNEIGSIETAEKIVAGYKDCPKIIHSDVGDKACYSPSSDQITMPNKSLFNTIEQYYSTLFHEMAHSTGHKKRLNRPGFHDVNLFGSHEYSKEELVAEIAASILACECGIDNSTIENSAAYISGWLNVFQKDMKIFWSAASLAQKAADYILQKKSQEVVE